MYEDLNEVYEDMYEDYYEDVEAQCDNDCVGCPYNIDDECRIDESEE